MSSGCSLQYERNLANFFAKLECLLKIAATNLEASINVSAFQLLLHDSADHLSMTLPVVQGLVTADALGRLANEDSTVSSIVLVGAGALKQFPFPGVELTILDCSFVLEITHQFLQQLRVVLML